jgi:hypothetical protein
MAAVPHAGFERGDVAARAPAESVCQAREGGDQREPVSSSVETWSQARGADRVIRIKHIMVREREALCGALVAGMPPSRGADPCNVCLDLSRRGFAERP